MKRVVISCGPIPARLDSVKFITNKFKGGLAFKTAKALVNEDEFNVTIIIWDGTPVPDWCDDKVNVVKIKDVYDYYNWICNNAEQYDAFIMAAAVANLAPVKPWEGKFPSHNYSVGEEFDIKFTIAPRAIDAVKKHNKRACLIGYKLFDGTEEELIDAAKITQKESKATIIFANHPATAKEKKLAITSDGTIIPCSFDEHIGMIINAIKNHYYSTKIVEVNTEDPHIREALAVVKMYENTFKEIGYGTVAVPIENYPGWFATTSRGHAGDPVVVCEVDNTSRTVYASSKATLNAPTLAVMLKYNEGSIIVHRHYGDPNLDNNKYLESVKLDYTFPGTIEEVHAITECCKNGHTGAISNPHGVLFAYPITAPDWNLYREQFPARYFSCPDEITEAIKNAGPNTLEIGANKKSEAKYVYDKYVNCSGAINLTEDEVFEHEYDLVYAKNAVNYIKLDFLKKILTVTDHFIANTFLVAPNEKITENEAVITDNHNIVHHNLRLKNDALIRHQFYAYSEDDYRSLGLLIEPYGKNSAIIFK